MFFGRSFSRFVSRSAAAQQAKAAPSAARLGLSVRGTVALRRAVVVGGGVVGAGAALNVGAGKSEKLVVAFGADSCAQCAPALCLLL